LYYNVIIRDRRAAHDFVLLDLMREELEEHILTPYRNQEAIVFASNSILHENLEAIKITQSDQNSHIVAEQLRKDFDSGLIPDSPSVELSIANKGKDVTEKFIYTSITASQETMAVKKNDPEKKRTVFVVHGRNEKLRESMFQFLRAIDLKPLEWGQCVSATGKGSPYVGEILDKAFAEAQAIVVLFTPDDEAKLRDEYLKKEDAAHERELTPQARQNVLFEAGMSMGRNADNTILVEVGRLKPFSDIYGRHVMRLDDSAKRRQELAQRLEDAGCSVNRKGTDWLKEGDFNLIPPVIMKRSNPKPVLNIYPDPAPLVDEALHEDTLTLLARVAGELGDKWPLSDLKRDSKLSTQLFQHHLDDLIGRGLVEEWPADGVFGPEIWLTKKGRTYLFDKGLLK